jgi:hypothetical protein
MLGAGKDRNESVPVALSIVALQSAEDPFGVFPQHV